jgi:hypothetical protein
MGEPPCAKPAPIVDFMSNNFWDFPYNHLSYCNCRRIKLPRIRLVTGQPGNVFIAFRMARYE